MIYSMTAFARHEIKKDWGNAVWEIRSVNQRYLENFSVCRNSSAGWKILCAKSCVSI